MVALIAEKEHLGPIFKPLDLRIGASDQTKFGFKLKPIKKAA
jgi:hypothetical protein